jgi:hypothetical protein
MKNITIDSTYTELKKPTLEVCVEKPPVARVAKEWQTASKKLTPPSIRRSTSVTVNRT